MLLREDVPAPESQPTSRASSLRSVLAYRAHPGVSYGPVQQGHPGPGRAVSSNRSNGSNGTSKPVSVSPVNSLPPLKYDNKYGYPV